MLRRRIFPSLSFFHPASVSHSAAHSAGWLILAGSSALSCAGAPGEEDAGTKEDDGDGMSFEDPDFGTGGGNADPSSSGGGLNGSGGALSASGGGLSTSGGATFGSGGQEGSTGGAGSGGSGSGGLGSGGLGSGGAGSGGSGSGGSGSGGSGTCTTSTPPSQFTQTLDATWQEMTGQLVGQGAGARGGSILDFDNSILDQIFENDGALNYCVRYESTVTLSATNRDKLVAALERNLNEWIDQIEGYDCFPYDHVPVKVVGWAAMNRSTFDWQDGAHPGLMYIGDDSFESAPQCAQACGRFFHKQPGYQYPSCSGGRANHYDMSLWLTEGMNGGAGGDWGQRVGRGYFVGAIDQSTLHILSHEMGHGFGFPDYYNWSTWVPGVPAPHSIMVAGAAASVTEWDTWMMRRLWSEMREDRGW